jgi:DMSO/TMAO reductase YedYZ heme-binding membrane subunit
VASDACLESRVCRLLFNIACNYTNDRAPESDIKPVMKVSAWRRKLGIWAAVTALAHIYIVMDGWVMWDLIMLFKVPFYDQLVLHPGFALGNLIGIVALGYLILLALISNQKSVRYLGSSAWNYLQQRSLILYVLVVLHTVYFIFFICPTGQTGCSNRFSFQNENNDTSFVVAPLRRIF